MKKGLTVALIAITIAVAVFLIVKAKADAARYEQAKAAWLQSGENAAAFNEYYDQTAYCLGVECAGKPFFQIDTGTIAGFF